MARNRQCILCETVHISKQEMDEHMRSMLHHRELEKLKGRDCGHQCRVCKVTVVSLTDYASHISSPVHKQNVEAAEHKHVGSNQEDYFDQAMVELVEKRKEQIRKDKVAAAKLAIEEGERKKKEQFQQRLKEAKDRYWMDSSTWQQPSQGFVSGQHKSWYGGNRYNARSGEARPWYNNRQGKSATWHAQEPPNFQRWQCEEFSGGDFQGQGGWKNRKWPQGGFSGNQQSRLPWLSGGESNNEVYGHDNASPRGRPSGSRGTTPTYPPPPNLFSRGFNQCQNPANEQAAPRGSRLHNPGGPSAELDHSSTKSSKTLGSNPKLDKTCRWSPYPLTKGSESVPHKDNHPNASEKHPKDPKPQKHDKVPESQSASNRPSRPEQKPGPSSSSGQSVEEKAKKTNLQELKVREKRSSCGQRETHQSSASAPSSLKGSKPSLLRDKKMASLPVLSAAPQISPVQAQSRPAAKQCGPASKPTPAGPLKSRQERQLLENPWKVRQVVPEKRGSLDNSSASRKETTPRAVEEQQLGVNKENSCSQNPVKTSVPDPVRPERPVLQSTGSSHFLQSLQVSTSTVESSGPASPHRKEVENPSCPLSTDEASQAAEGGHSSESDTSRGGDAAQTLSESNSSLSKLDLPPVLKRDLNKHISSKSKTGSHEPNLNIARRVRNLSESRRSDSEKDSGLKPTVRQLISSSGSRRNVNWDQVYQEVRKKQDKGKGMPRFGIEMVPNEQEDQSQEEDDIPLLEGLHWDSLMDISAPRKRSLSESSIAPESSASLFTSLMSTEMVHRVSISPEPQGPVSPPQNQDGRRPQGADDDCAPSPTEAKTEKQPETVAWATAKALQRSDSVLGDSSSGTELLDGPGTGKRRRAAGDVQSPETSSLEHSNKRRRVKVKKDRLQIDQLLAVSLREEELSRSLQTVDSNLIQARAALEAAYMEVQRLMVVKQQVTVEMGTLRNKRIELLKGMQGSVEEAPQVRLKEEKMDSLDIDPHVASSVLLSPVREAPPAAPLALHPPAAPPPPPPPQRSSPPPSSPPIMHVVIKQEPQSPVYISSHQDPGVSRFAHSTTPELLATPPADAVMDSHQSPESNLQLYQTNTEHIWKNIEEPSDSKESLSGLVEATEKAIQTSRVCLSPDSKSSIKLLSPSRRSSAAGSGVEPFLLPPVPASPPDPTNGKRVRKLKKRKVLKKAQGAGQPESSDTELDGEPPRPRWLRPRRRPSGGSQVTTSTPPSEEASVENGEEATLKREPDEHAVKLEANVDSEESMEVSPPPEAPAHTPPHVPDSSRDEPPSLACNEVTSTSDMDVCKSSESEIPFAITLPKSTKTSTDVSSDLGGDDLPTEGAFEGHQEAVNAMQVHNGLLYTCSGDRTVKAFDLVSHKCVGVFEGHSSKVSCLLVSAIPCLHHRLYTGSSDQTIRCYSLKTQELEQQFPLSDRVICLHSRWKTLYAGLANGTVVTFNLRTNKQMDVFECHGPRSVSCLASTQEGARRILLVGSYDKTITVRDAKNGLLLRTLEGHTKTVLCMKVFNDQVFSGSSDQCVYSHNIHTGKLVRVYRGHSHAVTVVTVLGKVMVTACLDKRVRVYDLQSHEQLQVYGGHKDMVMCMAVHKNMIYTGCYDGSVQAVKLNLMQNYRCWWHGCSLVFGLMEHLQQHLIHEHTGANLQTLKCRWKNCEFLCARNCSKQGILLHMRNHAEEGTDPEP